MSQKLIAHSQDLKRLLDEGYEVDVINSYLIIGSVPYVNAQAQVQSGVIVTDLTLNADEVLPPKDHQVWFVGDYPCYANGSPIEGIRNDDQARILWEGFVVQHRFSNKLFGASNYPDNYTKMKNYIDIISNEAAKIDPSATACTFKVVTSEELESIFKYHDTASSRADIVAISQKLAMNKIAIIGLGGTGSYILDSIVKTPIKEIHLFDGDEFLQHNAFRSPGAATIGAISNKLKKVNYYGKIYLEMRHGIFPHPEYVDENNIDQLKGFDFVFVSVDKGPVREVISNYLIQEHIPFIDVGMDLQLETESQSLFGTCRMTLATPVKSEHFRKYVPMMVDDQDNLYRKNIQVVEMNMLNAVLAVIKWKQYCGFYQDLYQTHHSTYSVNAHSLTRDEIVIEGEE